MAKIISNIGKRRGYFELGNNDKGTEHYAFARVILLGEDGQMLRIEKPILAYSHNRDEAFEMCTDAIKQRNDAVHPAKN